MKLSLYLGLYLLTNSILAQPKLVGVWMRSDGSEKVVEIFVIRSNGDFVSNLLSVTNQLTTIEKGTWLVKGDSIHFTFSEIIFLKGKEWISSTADQRKSVTMKFELSGEKLNIGSSMYFKEY